VALSQFIQHRTTRYTHLLRIEYCVYYDKFYQNIYANGVATAQDATGTVAISAYNNATQRDNIFNQTDFLQLEYMGSKTRIPRRGGI
jgi:catecholate siderophore receptor